MFEQILRKNLKKKCLKYIEKYIETLQYQLKNKNHS